MHNINKTESYLKSIQKKVEDKYAILPKAEISLDRSRSELNELTLINSHVNFNPIDEAFYSVC